MQDKPTSTMEVRALAIIAGLVFLSGTLAILFEDVIHGAPFALKHLLTLTILAGTIMAGHLMAEAMRQWRTWFAAVGFLLVFLSGTALVVYSSVGRQAAATTQVTATAEELNDRRTQISQSRVKAQGMLDQALVNYGKQCATGKGERCDGIKATIDVYQAAIKGHDAELKEIGWSRPVNPEAEQFAEIAAVVLGLDATAKSKIKAAALLVVPLLITLFLEFGTIQSFGYAFRRVSQRLPAPLRVPAPAQPLPVAFEPVARGGGEGPATKAEALDDLKRLLRRGQTIESQDELVQRWEISKGTCSKWLREWEDAGEIPARSQNGKCKQLAA